MSRVYSNRARPAHTTRPVQPRNAANAPTNAMDQPRPTNGEQDASPTPQSSSGNCYTVIPPNEKNRQKMQNIAKTETRNYEAHKQQNRPHYNYVGTVGGGTAGGRTAGSGTVGGGTVGGGTVGGGPGGEVHQLNHPQNNPQNVAQNRPSLTPQQKSRMYRDAEKLRKEQEVEKMRKEQREKSERNEEKDQQKAVSQRKRHLETNSAFLDRLEGKTPKNAGKAEGSGASAACSSSNNTPTVSAPASGSYGAELPSGFGEFSDVNRPSTRDELADALMQLQVRFPYTDGSVLEELLQQTGNDVETVTELLLS